MKKRKGLLLVVVLFLLLATGLSYIWKNSDYQRYVSVSGKYSTNVPRNWQIEESTESGKFVARVVFKPTETSFRAHPSNIGEMSVTVVSQPSLAQPFSRPEELQMWREKEDKPATGSGMIKLKNEQLGGADAVRVAEVDMVVGNSQNDWWSVTTWAIKDSVNYYVNMMGNGELGKPEWEVFEGMLKGFRF